VDQSAGITHRERDMQQPALLGSTHSVKAQFLPAMRLIMQPQERFIKKYLLGLRLAYIVLVDTLAGVARVPVKACDCCPIDHF
jgi:hypothetical protein